MSAMTINTSTARCLELLNLPSDIHESIISHLGFPEKPLLRMTCRHFQILIRPMTHAEIFGIDRRTCGGAERHPDMIQKDFFGCKECLRLRPKFKFADKMRRFKKGKWGKEPGKRFCVDCAIKPSKDGSGPAPYRPGTSVAILGVLHALCLDCGLFKKESMNWKLRMYCRECSQKYEAGPRELVETEEGHKDVVMETGDLIDTGKFEMVIS
jgi:hypothetical protein